MRVVAVFVLVLLNAAFLAWQLYRPAPPDERPLAPADPGVERLLLVGEVDELPEREPLPPKPQVSEVPAPAQAQLTQSVAEVEGGGQSAPQPHCGTVGPLDDRQAATVLADRLARLDAETQLREGEESVERYWVLLPPMASRAAAFRVDRALRSRGIRDLQVLGAEDRENAISLGLYRERESAERRVRQIRDMGYEPKLEVLERARAAFWIDYRSAQAPDARWEAVLVRHPRARHETRPCP